VIKPSCARHFTPCSVFSRLRTKHRDDTWTIWNIGRN